MNHVPDDRATVAHLLRRTGWPNAAEIDAASVAGYQATVDWLLDFTTPDPADANPPPTFAPVTPHHGPETPAEKQQRAAEAIELQQWWLNRMATTSHPLREKLTLFWHGHFATSIEKVRAAGLMYKQNQIFRTMGAGDFEALTQAVAKDPAMMIWLDARTDKLAHPNENFARELMELFTLGIGNYTETDVREAARAFTGWVINPATGEWALQARQHDTGSKTFLGQTGNWGGEDIIHIATTSAASAAYIVARLWSHFAYPVTVTDPIVKQLAPAFAQDRDMKGLVRNVLLHPAFTSDTARNGLVKQPIEWVVGSLRAIGLPANDRRLVGALAQLGQVPFRPPNVGGWPQNGYWLTTATSLSRLNIASAIATQYKGPAMDPALAARLFGVTWSPNTAKVLAGATGHDLLTLAMVSPEVVLA